MGQKVNPIGLRLGISRTWNSKWFAEKDYAAQLRQDLEIQKYVKSSLKHAAISKIEVERTSKKTKVNIENRVEAINILNKHINHITPRILNILKSVITVFLKALH